MKTLLIIAGIVLVGVLNFLKREGMSPESCCAGENSIIVSSADIAFGNTVRYSAPLIATWHPAGEIKVCSSDPMVADVAFARATSEIVVTPRRPGITKVSFTNSVDKSTYTFTVNVI